MRPIAARSSTGTWSGRRAAGFLLAILPILPFALLRIMYSRLTAAQLAARVRSLIGGAGPTEVHEAALELGVSERDLIEIVTYETRYPASAVLASLVAYHGVDAGWLLTGDYSPSLHRAVAEPEARETSRSVVDRLLREVSEPRAD